MPENEKAVNVHWLVGIAGTAEPQVVYAAYINRPEDWSTAEGVGAITGPVILKDANHKVVFRGSERDVQYVRRAQPGMALDRETGLWSPPAGEPVPAQPVMQAGMNSGYIPGAAGVPQVFTLNVPVA